MHVDDKNFRCQIVTFTRNRFRFCLRWRTCLIISKNILFQMMLSGCIPGELPVTSCMVQNALIFKKFILQNKKYWNEMTVGWFMFNQYTAKRLELVSISSLQTNKPHRCQCLTIYVILTRSCIKNIVWIGIFSLSSIKKRVKLHKWDKLDTK